MNIPLRRRVRCAGFFARPGPAYFRAAAALLALVTLPILSLSGCGAGTVATNPPVNTTPTTNPPANTTPIAFSRYSALGDSITCGYVGGATFSGATGSGCSPSYAYPSIIATDLNISLTNAGYPGDQACDLWFRDIVGFSLSPSTAARSGTTLMIGTNDANHNGSGTTLNTFTACYLAAATWMAVPAEAKRLAAAATADGSWSLTSNAAVGPHIATTTAGASAAFTVSTYGGPIMLWYAFGNSAYGSFLYTIDGGTPVSVGTIAIPALNLQTGNAASVGVVIASVTGTPTAPAQHTIKIIHATGATQIIGVGTPPTFTAYDSHPVVLTTDVPNVGPGGPLNAAAATDLNAAIRAATAQLVSYGLDVRFLSNHAYLTGQAAEFQADEVHPNHLGAQHLAQTFEAVLSNP